MVLVDGINFVRSVSTERRIILRMPKPRKTPHAGSIVEYKNQLLPDEIIIARYNQLAFTEETKHDENLCVDVTKKMWWHEVTYIHDPRYESSGFKVQGRTGRITGWQWRELSPEEASAWQL